MPRIVSRVRSKVKHQLRQLRRRTADKGLAMRCQVVLLWAEGEGPGAVARAVGCSPSWVGRVVGRFRDHGVAGLHDRREDNGQVKLDEAFLASLYEVVDTQPTDHGFPRPTWTQELLVEVMADRTGTRVHPGTMSRALRAIGARLGRPKPTVGCPWPAAAKHRRLAAIRRAVAGVGPGEVAVYLDEVDVHLNPKVGPDWMNRGKQKRVPTPGTNAKRYLCGALDVRTGRLTCVAAAAKSGQEQPAVHLHAGAAAGGPPPGDGDPRRAGRLQDPLQQAGAGVAGRAGTTHPAALPAAVLPGPQPDRAAVAGPARGRDAEPPPPDGRVADGGRVAVDR